MTHFESAAPVLTVRNIDAAVEHYRKLGFETRHYAGGAPYGFARRGDVQLHLSQSADLRPDDSTSAVYLYVDDADALFAEWKASGAEGHFTEPADTEYSLREGVHVDPDGNLLRYGSPLT